MDKGDSGDSFGSEPLPGIVSSDIQSGNPKTSEVRPRNAKANTRRQPIEGDRLVDLLDSEKPKVVEIQEIFIPVWGAVRLSKREMELIDHPTFARLGEIYQLGQTHYVFRGATHKRWEHSLGTLHAATLITNAISRNYDEAKAKNLDMRRGRWRLGPPLTEVERSFVRLAALLHDIGHVAAGHTFEDELGLLAKHDSDERLNHVLDRSVWRGVDSGTSLRTLVDQLYGPDAELTGLDKSASEIFLDMVSKSRTDVKTQTAKFRLSVCRDIVGNTICADLLDYLHRDWWHIGKPRDFDSRLLDYLEIREADFPLLDSRIVVNLREKAEIRSDGVSAIFDLLETRYLLGEVALFHRKKLTASAMLERLIAEISDASNDDDWFEARLDELLECSDEEMIQMLLRLGEGLCDTGGLSEDRRTRLSGCLLLAHRLRYRQLYKKVLAFKSHELSSSMQFVQENLGGANGKSNRLNSCRALEEDFHLPQGSVVIYCPNRAPHAKIAKVQVLVNGRVEQVAVLDSEQADPIRASGLFAAQLRRFEGLWRVQVSVSEEALRLLRDSETLHDFERTIECLILDAQRGSSSTTEDALDLGKRLDQNPKFDTSGKTLVAAGEIHSRQRTGKTYLTGAPTLSSLFID